MRTTNLRQVQFTDATLLSLLMVEAGVYPNFWLFPLEVEPLSRCISTVARRHTKVVPEYSFPVRDLTDWSVYSLADYGFKKAASTSKASAWTGGTSGKKHLELDTGPRL